MEPARLLEFRWGEHVLRCELVADQDGCRLLFSETFADASWGARNAAGWELCLGSLATILGGATLAEFAMDAWRKRFEPYDARFQPGFGRQDGPPETHPEVLAEKALQEGRGRGLGRGAQPLPSAPVSSYSFYSF